MRGHRLKDDPRLQLRRRCQGCFRQRAPPRETPESGTSLPEALFPVKKSQKSKKSRALMRYQLYHRVLREGQSSVASPIERVAASCGAILRKTLCRTRPQPNEPAPPD